MEKSGDAEETLLPENHFNEKEFGESGAQIENEQLLFDLVLERKTEQAQGDGEENVGTNLDEHYDASQYQAGDEVGGELEMG